MSESGQSGSEMATSQSDRSQSAVVLHAVTDFVCNYRNNSNRLMIGLMIIASSVSNISRHMLTLTVNISRHILTLTTDC